MIHGACSSANVVKAAAAGYRAGDSVSIGSALRVTYTKVAPSGQTPAAARSVDPARIAAVGVAMGQGIVAYGATGPFIGSSLAVIDAAGGVSMFVLIALIPLVIGLAIVVRPALAGSLGLSIVLADVLLLIPTVAGLVTPNALPAGDIRPMLIDRGVDLVGGQPPGDVVRRPAKSRPVGLGIR